MKLTGYIIAALAALFVGLMNTVFIRAEDIGSWKNYAGYLFLIIAVIDTFILVKKIVNRKDIETAEEK